MKNGFFARISLVCLPFLLIFVAGSNTSINKAFVNQAPSTEKTVIKKSDKSLQGPIEYVLEKLQVYDLVMIGERHWTHEEPVFIQNLIRSCFEKNAINVVFLEFGNFEDQGKIDVFMTTPEYDPTPVIDALRNSYEFGWGYQEYFDIFKLIYEENRKRPPSEKMKLVLTDGPPDDIYVEKELYKCIENSQMQEKQKWSIVSWLGEAITDRDLFMAEVINVYLFKPKLKGIYYAGAAHIRKDLRQKNYGRRLFSAGGILYRKYPGRVCCMTLHSRPENWQDPNDFQKMEKIFIEHGNPFAIDTKNPKIANLRLKSDIKEQGVSLQEAFDGYIMLNQDKDYQPCTFILGFYDDEFAKVVWDRLRKNGLLKRFPPELQKWKHKPWTGEELMELMKQGLH